MTIPAATDLYTVAKIEGKSTNSNSKAALLSVDSGVGKAQTSTETVSAD